MVLEAGNRDPDSPQLHQAGLQTERRDARRGLLQRRGRAARLHPLRHGTMRAAQYYVRPPSLAIQSTLPGEAPAPPKRPQTPISVTKASPPAKRAKSASKRTAKTPRTPKVKSKQPSKKQMAQEVDKRRKELAAFDKVWGEQNATVADGNAVVPPVQAAVSTSASLASGQPLPKEC